MNQFKFLTNRFGCKNHHPSWRIAFSHAKCFFISPWKILFYHKEEHRKKLSYSNLLANVINKDIFVLIYYFVWPSKRWIFHVRVVNTVRNAL